jgi:hypothetical protein
MTIDEYGNYQFTLDSCGRPFCTSCSGFHNGLCDGYDSMVSRGGFCYRHDTWHKTGEKLDNGRQSTN